MFQCGSVKNQMRGFLLVLYDNIMLLRRSVNNNYNNKNIYNNNNSNNNNKNSNNKIFSGLIQHC